MRGDALNFVTMGKKDEGCFLVRLKERGIVDHFVCISGSEGLIRDDVDEMKILLTPQNLRRMGGDNAKSLEIAEVHEVVVVRAKKSRKRLRQ